MGFGSYVWLVDGPVSWGVHDGLQRLAGGPRSSRDPMSGSKLSVLPGRPDPRPVPERLLQSRGPLGLSTFKWKCLHLIDGAPPPTGTWRTPSVCDPQGPPATRPRWVLVPVERFLTPSSVPVVRRTLVPKVQVVVRVLAGRVRSTGNRGGRGEDLGRGGAGSTVCS